MQKPIQDSSMRLRLSRDDRLWHLKNSDLPNAVSQSLRIQLTLNSDTDCRFQIRKHSIGGSRGALAHKMPLLTKRREPKPTNSAYAEFANQNAGSIGGKTFQGENRQTIAKSAAFCSFGTRRLHKRGLFLCQNAFPLKFDYF